MKQYVINFINYVIDKRMLSAWSSVYVQVLLDKINKEDERLLERGTHAIYPPDPEGRLLKIKDIEEYLRGSNYAQIISKDDKLGNEFLLTNDGKELLLAGSVAKYEESNAKKLKDEACRKLLDDKMKRSTISNAIISRRLLWMNFWIASTSYIVCMYYIYHLQSEVNEDYPCSLCSTSSIFLYADMVLLVAGVFLLILFLLKNLKKDKIEY